MTMSQSGSPFSSSSFSPSSFPTTSTLPLRAQQPTAARAQGLRRAVGILDSAFYLPDSPRAFMIYLLGLAIIFAGAFMHVLVAAQITEAQFRISQLRQEYRAIEQQNSELIFEIARETNLARLQARAREAGYVPVQQRDYVVIPATTSDLAAAAPVALGTVALGTVAPGTAHPAIAQLAPGQPVPAQPATQLTNWQAFWRGLQPQPTHTTPTQAGVQVKSHATVGWQAWWQSTLERGAEFVEGMTR
jgi:hypothetical protein